MKLEHLYVILKIKKARYEVDMSEREEKFEKMMQSVLDSYDSTVEKMDKLRQEGKTNTVTYKQLMAEKLKNQNIISLYKIYGLIEED